MVRQYPVSRINEPTINIGIPMLIKHAFERDTFGKNAFQDKIIPVLNNHPEYLQWIGLDGVMDDSEVDAIKGLPEHAIVINNNSEPMQKIRRDLSDRIEEDIPLGKGINVEGLIGLILNTSPGHIVLHDSDVMTYNEGMLDGLVCPIINDPSIDFLKSYFVRYATNGNGERKPYGRVNNLFLEPFIRAMKKVYKENKGVAGFIDELSIYKYKLSGEAAFSPKVASRIQLSPKYGMETDTLLWVYDNRRKLYLKVDQTDLGVYNHDHQPLGNEDNGKGSNLLDMAEDVATVILAYSQRLGIRIGDRKKLDELNKQYHIEVENFISGDYKTFLEANDCVYDQENLLKIGRFFSKAINKAADKILDGYSDIRLPAWTPELLERHRSNFIEAILETNPEKEYLFHKKIFKIPFMFNQRYAADNQPLLVSLASLPN